MLLRNATHALIRRTNDATPASNLSFRQLAFIPRARFRLRAPSRPAWLCLLACRVALRSAAPLAPFRARSPRF